MTRGGVHPRAPFITIRRLGCDGVASPAGSITKCRLAVNARFTSTDPRRRLSRAGSCSRTSREGKQGGSHPPCSGLGSVFSCNFGCGGGRARRWSLKTCQKRSQQPFSSTPGIGQCGNRRSCPTVQTRPNRLASKSASGTRLNTHSPPPRSSENVSSKQRNSLAARSTECRRCVLAHRK